MKKLTFLLLTTVLISCGFGQQPNKNQVATAGPAKRTQQAGPLKITAVNTEYAGWQSQFNSFAAWGVRVRVQNTTDQEVSGSFGEDDLQITDASGKRYSISNLYQNVFAEINLKELSSQGLQGNLLFSDTGGNAVIFRDGDTTIGELSRAIVDAPKIQNIYTIKLASKKSVTLVFVFDSPKESKPQTLFWPKAQPIDIG